MADKNYSKRELDHYFTDIKSILEKQNTTLERIEVQTTKTNGRVTKNENDIDTLKQQKTDARRELLWACGILVSITIFLFNYFK